MAARLKLGDIDVYVALKDIKNVHLSVNPPAGQVRISAPLRMSIETIRVFAISKLDWIKQQRKRLQDQQREAPREFLNRESHYVWGKRYLLTLKETAGRPAIELKHKHMLMQLEAGTDIAKKNEVLNDWYRHQVKRALPLLIAKWEPLLGVKVNRFFVQRMKTKWGSCTPAKGNVRFNTELAKKPPECLEYIVVHEMAHLLVRNHNERFNTILDRCLPNWRTTRRELNRGSLGTPLDY
jgi:predicted metal-dependent hydrolase